MSWVVWRDEIRRLSDYDVYTCPELVLMHRAWMVKTSDA